MSDTLTRFKPFNMTAEEAQALPALPGRLVDAELTALRTGVGRFTSGNLARGYRGTAFVPVGMVERRWLVVRPEDSHTERFVIDLGENGRCPTCGRYDR